MVHLHNVHELQSVVSMMHRDAHSEKRRDFRNDGDNNLVIDSMYVQIYQSNSLTIQAISIKAALGAVL